MAGGCASDAFLEAVARASALAPDYSAQVVIALRSTPHLHATDPDFWSSELTFMATLQHSAFLRLPTELRYDIYDYLSLDDPICYPFPSSPITSISHRAPPRQLLLACHKIHDEVRTHFYSRATFRLLALGSSRIKRADISPGTLVAIRRAKKVELMLMWNLTGERANANPKTWPWCMNGWLGEQVELLKDEGHQLELITISLRNASSAVPWEMKKKLIAPLRMLRGKVRFEVGEIITVQEEEEGIRKDIAKYVRKLNG